MLALNAVQQGDVYTKPEVNALVGGAVNEHNNSDTCLLYTSDAADD